MIDINLRGILLQPKRAETPKMAGAYQHGSSWATCHDSGLVATRPTKGAVNCLIRDCPRSRERDITVNNVNRSYRHG